MNNPFLSTAKSVLKLGVAGGVIFGIGFAIMTQDPNADEVGPTKAKADITDFMGAPASKSAQFTEAMVALGMKPRMYDYNGNVMFFAVGSSEKRPKQLMNDIQDHLVAYGVNKENRSGLAPMKQVAEKIDWEQLVEAEAPGDDPRIKSILAESDAMWDGDVVPTAVSENRIEMTGFDRNRPGEGPEVFEGDKSKRKVANLMGGYKYIDAVWGGHTTEVSAVWSAEDFSADRMEGKGNDQSPPDPDVPVCMGCNRDFRVQTIDGQDSFSANMFNTNLDVNSTFDYYKQRMEDRGWYEPGAQGMMTRLGQYMPELQALNEKGRVLHLQRGDGEAMQITIMQEPDNSTTVVSQHEAEDAQLAHPEHAN